MIENQLSEFSKNGVLKVEITASELMTVIKDLVKETSDAILMSIRNDENPQLITRKEAMQLLNIKTTNTMLSWEEKGYLNPHRIGSRIFYKKKEVIEAVESFERADLSNCA